MNSVRLTGGHHGKCPSRKSIQERKASITAVVRRGPDVGAHQGLCNKVKALPTPRRPQPAVGWTELSTDVSEATPSSLADSERDLKEHQLEGNAWLGQA